MKKLGRKPCVIVVKFRYGLQGANRRLMSKEGVPLYLNLNGGSYNFVPQANLTTVFPSIKQATVWLTYLKAELNQHYMRIGRMFFPDPYATVISYDVGIYSPKLREKYK